MGEHVLLSLGIRRLGPEESGFFYRLLRFSEALPKMRRTTNHLRRKNLDREKVLTAMTRLMNAAYFRVARSATPERTRPTA